MTKSRKLTDGEILSLLSLVVAILLLVFNMRTFISGEPPVSHTDAFFLYGGTVLALSIVLRNLINFIVRKIETRKEKH